MAIWFLWLMGMRLEKWSLAFIVLRFQHLKSPEWWFMTGYVELKGTVSDRSLRVKNPPANAGDKGSTPGPGRFQMPRDDNACTSQLLSQHPRTCDLKPRCLQPVLGNKRSHFNEKPVYHIYRVALTQRKPACSNEDPTQPYINQSILKKIKQILQMRESQTTNVKTIQVPRPME